MKNVVSVVMPDKIIVVDGVGFNLEFDIPQGIHALQWREGKGHVEYIDLEKENLLLTGEDYTKYILPYVVLWEKAKRERDEVTNRQPSLEQVRAEKLAEIMAKFSAMFAPITAIYPPEEQSSWQEQEADAARYMAWVEAGKQGEQPSLKILPQILLPDEDLEALCASVVAKGLVFKTVRNCLQAQQRAHYHTVLALQTEREIKDYVVTYDLPADLAAHLGV